MTAQELGMELVSFLQASAVIDRKNLTRAESMASLYGEACSKEQAAKLLNCTTRTVNNYIYEGRIRTCCAGKKVDVRSIAEWLEAKPTAKVRRKKEPWMV